MNHFRKLKMSLIIMAFATLGHAADGEKIYFNNPEVTIVVLTNKLYGHYWPSNEEEEELFDLENWAPVKAHHLRLVKFYSELVKSFAEFRQSDINPMGDLYLQRQKLAEAHLLLMKLYICEESDVASLMETHRGILTSSGIELPEANNLSLEKRRQMFVKNMWHLIRPPLRCSED